MVWVIAGSAVQVKIICVGGLISTALVSGVKNKQQANTANKNTVPNLLPRADIPLKLLKDLILMTMYPFITYIWSG
jgi:hypothetical protein